jgi:leader peptidase (prepilin peptidase)/N-methyltransferase
MSNLLPVFTFTLGAMVGSFLNVCIARIPNDESIVYPASHCPKCKAPIPFYCNIPLISYVWLRARCRSCSEPISSRYFLVELLTGLMALALYYRFSFGFEFIVGFIFVGALIVISFIDLDVWIIPNEISLPGIVLGFLFSVVGYFLDGERYEFLPSPLSSLVGIIAGGGFLWAVAEIYERVRKKEGMGGGDIKLLAMIGSFLGGLSFPITLFIASVLGSAVGLVVMVLKKTGFKPDLAIPFGPFLCTSAVLFLFFSKEIVEFIFPAL